jgi:hypothetical protein
MAGQDRSKAIMMIIKVSLMVEMMSPVNACLKGLHANNKDPIHAPAGSFGLDQTSNPSNPSTTYFRYRCSAIGRW